jgi:hypothetical protein
MECRGIIKMTKSIEEDSLDGEMGCRRIIKMKKGMRRILLMTNGVQEDYLQEEKYRGDSLEDKWSAGGLFR